MKNPICRYLEVVVLSSAFAFGVGIAQEREHADAQQNRHYEDKAHNDSHEWNENEDRAYRQYLQEHHKKYHEFAKAKKAEQEDYWNWRHSHPDGGRQ